MRQLCDVFIADDDLPLTVGDTRAVVADPDLRPVALVRDRPSTNGNHRAVSVLDRIFNHLFERASENLVSSNPQLFGKVYVDVGWISELPIEGPIGSIVEPVGIDIPAAMKGTRQNSLSDFV